MFTGVQSYGSFYRPREMGETPADMAKAQQYQKQKSTPHEYRGREMGEKPWEVPSREQQQANYDKATAGYASAPTRGTSSRPREMGETPEDVARNNQPKDSRQREMTEQEKRLDMYA
ncbi:MAG: hypothetical protein DKM23_07160 [Candidatus Melainabacteria bacterium]|nr:MAG: hypothetical protein DKM23_07160 [Candidatus Melainabacteria bacterium]